MTISLGYGLTCLTPEDYAAIALYLQSNALAIESQLGSQQDEFEGFLDAPTAVLTSTATQTGINSGNQLTGPFATTFANYAVTPGLAATGVLTYPAATPGIYHVGAYANLVASAGITANSLRELVLTIQGATTLDPFALFEELYVSHTETSTGGEHLVAQGTVVVPAATTVSMRLNVIHTNAASTLNAIAGVTLWLTYLGPVDLIRSS